MMDKKIVRNVTYTARAFQNSISKKGEIQLAIVVSKHSQEVLGINKGDILQVTVEKIQESKEEPTN